MYDFDKEIDRRGTGALKTDGLKELYGRSDLMAMWVADMDFETPDFVMDAVKKRMEHPILGYTKEPEGYGECVMEWMERQHGYRVEKEWLTYIPGVVKGIGLAINFFTKPGEGVMIQPPVYHPFRSVTAGNHRRVVENPLKERTDGGYEMDWEGMERAAEEGCRMLILSSPHNPGGVVWSADTLGRVARIAKRTGMVVVSDEIHADMPLFGAKHCVFTSVSEEAAECGVVFGAPSKTFNMAGVVSSYCIVPNEALRKGFYAWLGANEQNVPNLFAPIATMAAYEKGDEWRREMLGYVEGNVRLVEDYCRERIPGVRAWRPKASFLVWLDCRGLGLDHEGLVRLFVEDAGLALNDGEMFGPQGAGFMRMNVGCPRSVVRKAMDRLETAVKNLKGGDNKV